MPCQGLVAVQLRCPSRLRQLHCSEDMGTTQSSEAQVSVSHNKTGDSTAPLLPAKSLPFLCRPP
jgi:hypothetical protein